MFLYSKWLSLHITTRHKLAEKFGFKKTGPTHVVSNVMGQSTVQSDGYAVKDIEGGLNKDTIQKFLDSKEESLEKLWDSLIDKIEGRTPFDAEEKRIIQEELKTIEIKTNAETKAPEQK